MVVKLFEIDSVKVDCARGKLSYSGSEAIEILSHCDEVGNFVIVGEFGDETRGKVDWVFYHSCGDSCPIPYSYEQYTSKLQNAEQFEFVPRIVKRIRPMLEDYCI